MRTAESNKMIVLELHRAKKKRQSKGQIYRKGRAWIELDEKALLWNVSQFRQLLPPECKIMAAVKANAYGHGSAEAASLLQKAGVEDFCVASVSEGAMLRGAGIRGQILILGYTHPALLCEVTRYDLTQTVVDAAYARELEAYGFPVRVHIGVDTGMHRLGERFDRTEQILSMWSIPNLRITGIYSHLCAADDEGENGRQYTLHQMENFRSLLLRLREAGAPRVKAHLLSSYGVLNYPGEFYDYARIGIALYGILSSVNDTTQVQLKLRPVLSLKTRIESTRILEAGECAGYGLAYTADCRRSIAALAVGYADGVPRALSNRGYVLVQGCRAPVIGRICMDQMLVDVTGIPGAVPGTEAVLIGKSGEEEISAPLFASWADTISNEILSRLGGRLERIVV